MTEAPTERLGKRAPRALTLRALAVGDRCTGRACRKKESIRRSCDSYEE